MRFPPVSEIRHIRKGLDITQSQLAAESGISQSTIAKIEGGRTSASYETVVRLFETLDEIKSRGGSDIKAIDVASHDIVSVTSSDLLHTASDLMRRSGYSQLPVIDDGFSVGSISERVILEILRNGTTMEELAHTRIADVMKGPFPVVPDTTHMSAVTGLIEDNSAVLVSTKGKIVGMLTNADVLKLV